MIAIQPRSLDHLVHAVRDLDAAAAVYERLGFIVGVRNRHPWGTHNRIVQLDGVYIELLTVAEPEKIPPHGPKAFSFGAFQRDFLAAGEGLSMLLLKSDDAAEDARAFAADGIGDFDTFHFARDGVRPDGSPVRLAFTLAYAVDTRSPLAGFGVCQHHFPESFWSAAAQAHPNAVRSVKGVALTADNPTDHHIFLEALLRTRDIHATSLGLVLRAGNAEVEMLEAPAFRDETGVTPIIDGDAARFVAIRFASADLDRTAATLRASGAPVQDIRGRLIVPPSAAFGATLIFERRVQG